MEVKMSKEFNYKRAWKEYVQPEYLKLSKEVHKTFNALYDEVDNISQVGASKTVTGYSPELMAMFDAIPSEDLAWAHEVVYYYGHLASGKEGQKAGANWKFQDMANMNLIKRKSGEALESLRLAHIKMKKALKDFHDHKEDTEYGNDELPGYLLGLSPNIGEGILKIYKADNVNHKPDMFCIGPQHIDKSTGMYLDPNVAPCAHCKQPYSAHTSDRVLVFKPIINDGTDTDTFTKDNSDKIKSILKNVVELCVTNKIKIDGFVFIK
jgi:hypothetical protein